MVLLWERHSSGSCLTIRRSITDGVAMQACVPRSRSRSSSRSMMQIDIPDERSDDVADDPLRRRSCSVVVVVGEWLGWLPQTASEELERDKRDEWLGETGIRHRVYLRCCG